MGRPILKICAFRGCDVTDCRSDPEHAAGENFSVNSCLAKGVQLDAESQVRLVHSFRSVLFCQPSCRLRMSTQLELDFCSFGPVVRSIKTARCKWCWKACLTEIANTSLSLMIRPWAATIQENIAARNLASETGLARAWTSCCLMLPSCYCKS